MNDDARDRDPVRGEDEAPIEPLAVNPAWRGLLAVSALALLATGAVSILTSDNEVGTAAIAFIGAVLLIVAALGQWPSRFTWGDKSAEFYGVGRLRRAVSSGADPEEVADVASEVARTPLERLLVQQVQTGSAWWRLVEEAALERLDRLCAPLGALVIHNAGEDRSWDARIALDPSASPDDSVLVIVDPASPMGTGRTFRLVKRIRRALGYAQAPAVLVLTDYDPGPEWRTEVFRRLIDAEGMSPSTQVFVGALTEERLAGEAAAAVAVLRDRQIE